MTASVVIPALVLILVVLAVLALNRLEFLSVFRRRRAEGRRNRM
ncbi:hypothetical protein [Roseomonas sp. GC11]|nr:hypothetical protein [Roseomonas sp. GC11]